MSSRGARVFISLPYRRTGGHRRPPPADGVAAALPGRPHHQKPFFDRTWSGPIIFRHPRRPDAGCIAAAGAEKLPREPQRNRAFAGEAPHLLPESDRLPAGQQQLRMEPPSPFGQKGADLHRRRAGEDGERNQLLPLPQRRTGHHNADAERHAAVPAEVEEVDQAVNAPGRAGQRAVAADSGQAEREVAARPPQPFDQFARNEASVRIEREVRPFRVRGQKIDQFRHPLLQQKFASGERETADAAPDQQLRDFDPFRNRQLAAVQRRLLQPRRVAEQAGVIAVERKFEDRGIRNAAHRITSRFPPRRPAAARASPIWSGPRPPAPAQYRRQAPAVPRRRRNSRPCRTKPEPATAEPNSAPAVSTGISA